MLPYLHFPTMKLAYYMVRNGIYMPGMISYKYMLMYWTVVNMFQIDQYTQTHDYDNKLFNSCIEGVIKHDASKSIL